MKNVIEIKDLEKTYDNFKLGLISLDIPSGYIIGLIGENGAGKTTLIKTILNIIKVNNGSIKIFNKDLNKEESIIKEDIGVVLDNSFFPELLSIKDVRSIMKDLYKSFDEEMFNNYLTKFNLLDKQIIKKLSKGMRKKLEIITALSHHPKLLILDEPTSGLDPVVREDILDLFLDFISDDNHTILLSTHITKDLERISDKIIFIDNGKVYLNEYKDDILENYGILKCDSKEFEKLDKEDYISYKKNKYNYEVLVSDKKHIKKKYKNYVIDNITLDDLMVLIIKGEK